MTSTQTVSALVCRECQATYPLEARYVCDMCFGPLEAKYNYEAIATLLSQSILSTRDHNMWRYRELLPITQKPVTGLNTGFTPLIRAKTLERIWGAQEVYIKNDAVNAPTLSFKDRVVAVALTRAIELGFTVASCASTGNLANSVAAQAAACGMKSFVFIPFDLEPTKINATLVYGARVAGIRGSYDDVNRLCSEIANRYPWAFVNVNMRPYYAEGSKTMGFEICEQLGFRAPDQVVAPMASGSLLTKIFKAIHEFHKIGLIPTAHTKLYGAQATGCSPISASVKAGVDFFKPVKPGTIAKSLAIGNPADGYYANRCIAESRGHAEDVSDAEILQGIRLLAESEGIFAETAGGVTVAVTQKLIQQNMIDRKKSIVICITGNGLKTQEALVDSLPKPVEIPASFVEFEKWYHTQ